MNIKFLQKNIWKNVRSYQEYIMLYSFIWAISAIISFIIGFHIYNILYIQFPIILVIFWLQVESKIGDDYVV